MPRPRKASSQDLVSISRGPTREGCRTRLSRSRTRCKKQGKWHTRSSRAKTAVLTAMVSIGLPCCRGHCAVVGSGIRARKRSLHGAGPREENLEIRAAGLCHTSDGRSRLTKGAIQRAVRSVRVPPLRAKACAYASLVNVCVVYILEQSRMEVNVGTHKSRRRTYRTSQASRAALRLLRRANTLIPEIRFASSPWLCAAQGEWCARDVMSMQILAYHLCALGYGTGSLCGWSGTEAERREKGEYARIAPAHVLVLVLTPV